MLGKTYDAQNCSAARALEFVGERWSLLIIRDAMFGGLTRFSQFERSLGVAPNVLTNRLEGFVAGGLMETRRYSDEHDHVEYVLTDKGRDLQPIILALTAWGDRYAAADGPPVRYEHAECGGAIEQLTRCAGCGEPVEPDAVVVVLQPIAAPS